MLIANSNQTTRKKTTGEAASLASTENRLPPNGIVVHALHKSATMFLYWFYQRLADKNGYEFYSPNKRNGSRPTDPTRLPQRFCECPVRTFRIQDELDHNSSLYRIFQIRDPRDILVSQYYSVGWIHNLRDKQMAERRKRIQNVSIDDYVLHQAEISSRPLENKLKPLFERLDQNKPTDIVLRYETMTTNFQKWLRLAIVPFQYRLSSWQTAKLSWKYRNEFRPDAKNRNMGHKRQVTPGDYLRQFKPKTIEKLNDRFAPFLTRFGYEI